MLLMSLRYADAYEIKRAYFAIARRYVAKSICCLLMLRVLCHALLLRYYRYYYERAMPPYGYVAAFALLILLTLRHATCR